MRNLLGPLPCRASASALVLASARAPGITRATAPPAPEAPRIPFAERHHGLPRGGFARVTNTSVSCRTTPGEPSEPPCQAAREGEVPAVNGDFDRFYIVVVDVVVDDPGTYNSSRAELRLPAGSRVRYARLYRGGNLPAGEQKPAADDGRVLIAEPGCSYQELLADTIVGHRVGRGADAFQASEDVTGPVRAGGPGPRTVGQVNAAAGRSGAGAWGGWTLVVAYEDPAQPLRTLSLRDGFDSLGTPAEVRLNGLPVPRGAEGRVGQVAYNGDRGTTGDSLIHTTAGHAPVPLQGPADPADDVVNSTINEPGPVRARREPAYANTLGHDSDVFDLGTGLAHGGDRLTFRLVSQRDAAWAGALFAAVDAR
ncbi:DUF3344 domain-containing protein [Streptomyces sp. NPDC086777]|uniref:DUF3344 domain-containing protein n=1 Tax=Streptomyces sp. NPDC086777 TaxID=3154866 RepID=UPI00344D60E6